MTSFESLRNRHNELLELLQADAQENNISPRAKEFIQEARQSGSKIFSPRERDQLRAMLRYWAGYLYDNDERENGTYPVIDLAPYSGLPIKTFSAPWVYAVVVGIILIFAIIALIIFRQSTSPERNPTPTEKTDSVLATAWAAETAMAISEAIVEATSNAGALATLTAQAEMTPSAEEELTDTVIAPPTKTPEFTPEPTAAPLALPSFTITSPQNGAVILPEITFKGTYENLTANWSIHVLLQPLSSSGLYFPLPDSYSIPENSPSGEWQILAALQNLHSIEEQDTLIITLVVANNDSLRNKLAQAVKTGLPVIPEDAIVIENNPITVTRPAYRLINEDRLVFASFQEDEKNSELFTANLDGSDVLQLSSTTDLSEGFPSLSTDGQSIAFTGVRWNENGDAIHSIWIMDSSGKNRRKLMEEPGFEYGRVLWSPNDLYLSFSSRNTYNSSPEEWIIRLVDMRGELTLAKSSDTEQLITAADVVAQKGLVSDRYPIWLDETTILFSRHTASPDAENDAFALYTLDITTLEEEIFLELKGQAIQSAISPDGKRMALVYTKPNTNSSWDIYLTDLLSGDMKQVTTDPERDLFPTWSTDNHTIYYQSYATDNPTIWAIGAGGDNPRQIIFDVGTGDYAPDVGFMSAYLPAAK